MSTYTYDMPDEPPPSEDVVAEIRVVRIPEGRGRPMFLTPRRFIRVCQWIEKGESATGACNLEFVGYQSFRAHVRKRPSYARRLKKAEEIRENLLREFHIANMKKTRREKRCGFYVLVRASLSERVCAADCGAIER
jgi:hypothetical protein